MTWFDVTWFDVTWFDVTWFDVTWFDVTWFDMTWFDVTCFILRRTRLVATLGRVLWCASRPARSMHKRRCPLFVSVTEHSAL